MPRSSRDTASTTENDEPRQGWGTGLFRMLPVRSLCPRTQTFTDHDHSQMPGPRVHVLLTATRGCWPSLKLRISLFFKLHGTHIFPCSLQLWEGY